jgi:hypothetical protein
MEEIGPECDFDQLRWSAMRAQDRADELRHEYEAACYDRGLMEYRGPLCGGTVKDCIRFDADDEIPF